MRTKTKPFLIAAFLLFCNVVFGQLTTHTNRLAISVTDYGNQKTLNGVTSELKTKTGCNVITTCVHLNLILLEYNADMNRDVLSFITLLKQKGFQFEVRKGITAENIQSICNEDMHNE